jgi:tRNA(fMet)-specific endonuclease VapC
VIFALDTNTIIHAFKGQGNVRARLSACQTKALRVPSLVVHELEYGALRSRDPRRRGQQLRALLEEIEILPFDGTSARTAAEIRLQLEERGELIGPLDLLIAGTVLSAGAVLVTHNHKEFSRVPGLRLEDWF